MEIVLVFRKKSRILGRVNDLNDASFPDTTRIPPPVVFFFSFGEASVVWLSFLLLAITSLQTSSSTSVERC